MKKLKCESCGGTIEIDDDKEFATCPFCKTKYKLNETKNIYIKLDDNTKEILEKSIGGIKKTRMLIIIPAIIVFIAIFAITISSFINFNKTEEDFDDIIENNNNDVTNTYEEIKTKISKSSFNSKFETYSGTDAKIFVESLLDNVVTNNKTNKDMLVTVIYKEKSTTDPDEIVDIKHSLNDRAKYEVKLDYDDDGYVSTVTIEDL